MSDNISYEQAIDAVKTILKYIGEDINREGLQETPKRVVKSYSELFQGYKIDIAEILSKQFHEIADYENPVLLNDISFTSICEHHMLPFTGIVDIAYIPNNSVIGISKLARLVDVFAYRLQIQEKMTKDIASAIHKYLKPHGVAVHISAQHSCMSMRGVKKHDSMMHSYHFTGKYYEDIEMQNQFLKMTK